MVEDTSSAAWYQQSVLALPTALLWTVKECIDDFEYHLIRRVEFHHDFYHSLSINKGLPPTSLDEATSL